MNLSSASPSLKRIPLFVFLGLALMTLGILFYHTSDTALTAMDAPASQYQRMQGAISSGFSDLWFIEPWLGQRYATLSPDLNALVLRCSSYPWSLTLLFTLNLLVAGAGMFFLLRSLKLGTTACVFGGLAFLLTNTVLTLVLAGHVSKFMTYAWLPFSVAFFLTGLRDRRLRDHVISGAFLGLALLGGEVQICYYLGLWYAVWLALSLWNQHRQTPLVWKEAVWQGVGLALVAALALGVGLSSTLHSLRYLSGNAPVTGGGDTALNWRFATQFFFPPEELLSYLTTIQFFGAPEAYWGRTGTPTPLRLSDDYMGLLPLGFAVLGGIACWRIWQARLFIFMAIGSLLISFGREGGLFWLLYQLPTMKSQRNPHRWIYFVSLAVCVLAAYGCNWLLSQLRSTNGKASPQSAPEDKGQVGEILHSAQNENSSNVEPRTSNASPSWDLWKRALLAGALLGAVLFVIAGALNFDPQSVASFFYASAQMNSPQAPLLVERAHCMLAALTRTGFFGALSALAMWGVIASGRRQKSGVWSQKAGSVKRESWNVNRQALAWLAVLLVLILDLGLNAKRYIQFYPWKDVYEKNELVNFLRQDKDFYRVKVLGAQQNQLLNHLVLNVLPYHRIPVVDPLAMSRMPNDYAQLLGHIQNHYTRSDRYFDYFNVKYVLSPGPFADPITPFTLVAQWNGINVYQRPGFLPRVWLASSAVVMKEREEAVIAKTMHPETDLREVVVMEETPKALPPFEVRSSRFDGRKSTAIVPDAGKDERSVSQKTSNVEHRTSNAPPRTARLVSYEDNRLTVETEASVPTMLVMSEKWDPDWKAWVDGQPARIWKANFLMRAVELTAGKHTVRMEYRPSTVGFWISAISMGLFALYGIGCGLTRIAKRGARNS